ncbi:MAG: solute:sodium symporter family transporter [Acidobacteria bacterium]|nr:solute:sodium symporter family transporter [Acidobacteriota bacterium]
MELSFFDIASFMLFFLIVVGVSMYKSRKEESGEDFFLAGRGLLWPMIGLSLIAANISTEQIVGQAGQGAGNVGLAVASYEWMASITLVFVAFFFLPRFLRSGIFTMPEYLEHRYNAAARGLMAFYTLVIYVGVTISAVIYSGALTIHTIFDMNLWTAVWLLGGIAALYTTWGGLKAVAWADLFLGGALLAGGLVVVGYGFSEVGGVQNFMSANADRLHMILPRDHPVLPWTALIVGLWIPNFYYWGLNQYITQRSLAAKTIRQGQMGVLFAAFLKLLIPFIVIFPGIMACQLYGDRLAANPDAAYPLLIRNLIPIGIRGFIFAAIAGAVISSLASMLNSASTVFTMDLYKRHLKADASPKSLVTTGRVTTLILVVLGCLIAPQLGNPRFQGIFNYIQEFQGFVSPGILAAFVFGMIFKKSPPSAGVAALVTGPVIYGVLFFAAKNMAFLNRMAVTFALILAIMALIAALKPLDTPKAMPVRDGFEDIRLVKPVKYIGIAVIGITLILYALFW